MAGLAFVLVATLAFLGYAATHRTRHAVLPPPGGHHGVGSSAREAQATALLVRLRAALSAGSRSRAVTLAAPGDPAARSQLAALAHNAAALRLTDLGFRYVDEDPGALSANAQRPLHGRGFVADVQLSWRIEGFDAHPSDQEVSLTLETGKKRASFVSARGHFGRDVPLWLQTRLTVRRSPTTLVMVAGDQSARRFAGLAQQAVIDVRKVLPHWPGHLVVEVPGSQTQLDRVFGAGRNDYNEIAAVTTTADDRNSRTAPVHVFVNPQVFDPLGPIGSQVVLSHEATHVAMHAATSQMPTWLLEGFADFVALDHENVPVSSSASQILAQVRKHGPPAQLPGPPQFDTQNPTLGAQYEAAWLACRLLAQEYGEKKLIAFYRQADRDSSTQTAFPDVYGITQAAFTKDWRNYLRQLAGGGVR